MQLLNKIRHSLSLRLLLLFVAAGIVLGIVFQAMIGYAISSHIIEKGTPHLKQYFSYIQSDLGSPPSIERAKKLVIELPIDIQISNAETSWNSAEITPSLDNLHRYRDNKNPKQTVNIGFQRGQTTVQIIDGDTSYSLDQSQERNRAIRP